MSRRLPFPHDPAGMLRFANEEAVEKLGGNGNSWLGLLDVATSRMQRSQEPAERDIYYEVMLKALEGLGAYTKMDRSYLSLLAIRKRVNYLHRCDRDAQWKRQEVAAIYAILTTELRQYGEEIFASHSRGELCHEHRLSVSNLVSGARILSKFADYLPVDDRAHLEKIASLCAHE